MEIANEKKIAELVQFLRKGRTMTGRFRLPMLEEQAYEYLLAAYIMEVQLRYRRFIYNGFVEEQLKQVANCLTANTAKFGIVLCGGCGNGKTTMLKALQNLVSRLIEDIPEVGELSADLLIEVKLLDIVLITTIILPLSMPCRLCKSARRTIISFANWRKLIY